MDSFTAWLARVFGGVETEVEVTLEDVHDALHETIDAKNAYVDSLFSARDAAKQHNQQAQATIAALSKSIADTQARVDTADSVIAHVASEIESITTKGQAAA